MNRNTIWALVILAVVVVILIVNRGSVSVDLLLTTITLQKSFAFLGFTAVGVLVGVLLK